MKNPRIRSKVENIRFKTILISNYEKRIEITQMFNFRNGDQRIYLNDQNVTKVINFNRNFYRIRFNIELINK